MPWLGIFGAVNGYRWDTTLTEDEMIEHTQNCDFYQKMSSRLSMLETSTPLKPTAATFLFLWGGMLESQGT